MSKQEIQPQNALTVENIKARGFKIAIRFAREAGKQKVVYRTYRWIAEENRFMEGRIIPTAVAKAAIKAGVESL